MDAAAWAKAKELIGEALERPSSERAAFLRDHCTDPDLLDQMQALLAEADPGTLCFEPMAPLDPLESGTPFGPYVILELLGRGGMGDVYKARDTRLDRIVALKMLPSADAELRQRFEREAKAIAALTHPHICALYDVGRQEGTDYLVMEYLEGETLADRIRKGALPLDRALTYASEIADALNTAHRAGIVHRDLKPGNIMLTMGGAKLVDFGLAKLRPPPTAVSFSGLMPRPTSASATAKGTLLGTVQYMAPEQLEGQEADARTDLFAFGTVLYEMLTGKTAFAGHTHASLISAILKDEPGPISRLQSLSPPALDRLVKTCLAKDPDERWQSARDLLHELDWITESRTTPGVVTASSLTRLARLILGVAVAVAGLIVGVAATVLVTRWGGGRSTGRLPEVTRFLVSVAPAEHLQATPADRTTVEGRPSRTAMVWSPDGRSVVFSAVQGDRQQLYVRALDQLAATAMPGTDGASNPFFSPDGRWLGFWSGGALKKISVDGSGPAMTICETTVMFGASWGLDDTIIFSREREGLWRVSASTGALQALSRPDPNKGELKYLLPQILPGNRAILFTVTHTPLPRWDDTEVVVQSLATGERKVLVHAGADGRYVSSGHLLFVQQGTLMAVPFDLPRLEVTGGAVALIANVMQAANMPNEAFDSGAGQFSVSESGSLLYVSGGIFPDPERSLVWVDRTGALQPLSLTARAYLSPRLSPDGLRVTFWTQGDRNIWVHDLSRGTLTRLTIEGRNARAIWTPDSARITYGSAAGGTENLFWKPADGSGPAERLTTRDYQSVASSWSPDGQTLAFVENHPTTLYDIWVLSLAGDRRSRPIVQTRFTEAYPEFSPDGRWLAYASDESGRTEVYVQPYPGPGPRQQVSTDGGTAPAWSRDGRELFYTTAPSIGGQANPTKMMVVPVASRPRFTAGAPRMLFQGKYGASAMIRGYDVTADGRRFLMVQQKERPAATVADMILVQHWVEELKRRVPTGR